MRHGHWWVVGSMGGLRCEQHPWEPDNALAGPYKTGEIAAIAMHKMIERDRWEHRLAWIALGVVVAFVVWRVVAG